MDNKFQGVQLTVLATQLSMMQAELKLHSILLMQILLSTDPPEGIKDVVSNEIQKRDESLERLQSIMKQLEDSL